MKEGFKLKLKYWLYDKKLKVEYIVQGIKNIYSINLGDIVIYDGKRYFVNNGASSPTWDLLELESNEHIRVNSKDFKKEISIRNIKNAIRSTYRFQIGYWHRIRMDKLD